MSTVGTETGIRTEEWVWWVEEEPLPEVLTERKALPRSEELKVWCISAK